VVLTAAAGARRTYTAYPRLLNWANAAQLDVLPGALVPPYFAALTRMPQVTAMSWRSSTTWGCRPAAAASRTRS
jgi:hypothetical protein